MTQDSGVSSTLSLPGRSGMALEVVGGSALGVAFGELATSVPKVKHNNAMFKATVEQLEATNESLYPVIEEMQDLNK